jgi:hypothetical protein
MIRSQKVLRSAKGQPCSARFPGICNGNPETTVWAHLNGGAFGKGMGMKAHDVLGFHACFACHNYLDTGHGTRPILSNDTLLECVLSAVCETYVRLIVAGIVIVPQDIATPLADRPAKPRKPASERTKIPHRNSPIPKRADGLQSRNSFKKQERK